MDAISDSKMEEYSSAEPASPPAVPPTNIFLDPAFEIFEPGDWICNNCTTTFPASVSIGRHFFTCLKLQAYMNQFQSAEPEPPPKRAVSSKPCPSKKFRCRFCSKIRAGKYNLILHEKRCRDLRKNQIFSCSFCSEAFPGRTRFVVHLRTAHRKEWRKKAELRCTICPRSFMYPSELRNHLHFHSGVKPWTCSKCSRSFIYKYQLTKHEQEQGHIPNERETKKPFQCQFCSARYSNLGHLNVHSRAAHSGRPQIVKRHSCPICPAKYSKPSRLRAHAAAHSPVPGSNQALRQCNICKASFATLTYLATHQRAVHQISRIHKCGHCGDFFPTLAGLKGHQNTQHPGMPMPPGERSFKCTLCSVTYAVKYRLTRHQRRAHNYVAPPPPPLHRCHLCSSPFSIRNALEEHMVVAHNRKLNCSVCRREFTYSNSLRRHMVRHAANPGKGFRPPGTSNKSVPKDQDLRLTFKCNFCSKVLLAKKSRLHHCSNMPYKCTICGAGFLRRRTLMNHTYRHRKVSTKAYACALCNTGFNTIANLNAHLKSLHSLDPPEPLASTLPTNLKEPPISLQCTNCSNVFSSQANLAFHLKTHFGKFRCTVCHASFSDSSHLQKHIVIHEPGSERKPYQCTFCRAGFGSESTWMYHLNVLHGKAPPTLNPEEVKCTETQKSFGPNTLTLGSTYKTQFRPKVVKCKVCKVGFRHPSHLAAHSRVHRAKVKINRPKGFGALPRQSNGKRRCKVCPALFRRSREYTAHMKIHTKDKAHACTTCEATFDCPSHLKAHYRVHSKVGADGESGSTASPDTTASTEPRTPEGPIPASPPEEPQGSKEVDKGQGYYSLTPKGDRFRQCRLCPMLLSGPIQYELHMKIHTRNQPVPCGSCGATFDSLRELGSHARMHAKADLAAEEREPSPEVSVKTRSSLAKLQCQCDLCPTLFSSHQDYLGHMKIHTGNRTHVCLFCRATFDLPHQLLLHKRVHRKAKPGAEAVADEGQGSEEPMVRVLKGMGRRECRLCPIVTSGTRSYLEHIKSHPGAKPLLCFTCEATFDTVDQLRSHAQLHAKAGESGSQDSSSSLPSTDLESPKPGKGQRSESDDEAEVEGFSALPRTPKGIDRQCKYCPKVVNSETAYVTHMKTHGGKRPFLCDLCGETFYLLRVLEIHLRGHAKAAADGESGSLGAPSPKKAKGQGSDAEITKGQGSDSEVTKGQGSDSEVAKGQGSEESEPEGGGFLALAPNPNGRRGRQCKFCPKVILDNLGYLAHMKIHGGNRALPCDFCGATFDLRSSLDSHLRVHSQAAAKGKPGPKSAVHKCHLCKAEFGRKLDLRKHIHSHTP